MDLAMGALGSLLPKLAELLNNEYKLQKGVKKDVEFLEAELTTIHTALGIVAKAPQDELDDLVKLWAGDLRELSYDMEDVVDSLLVRVEGSEQVANTNWFKGLMGKMKNLFKKGKDRHQIATAINDIKEQVHDVANRRERNMLQALGTRTKTTIDPFLVALYDQKNIVGIDGPRDEIIAKLCEGDDVSKLQLKILSIVGFGGLGKTTLAKAVYDSLQGQFDCTAFVSVSRIFDMMQVFKDIFVQLDAKIYNNMRIGELFKESQLIDQLRQLLQTKRYFIVVDDLWDINAWNMIKYALQDNKNGSRIITTTRNVSISNQCCSSDGNMNYSMKPLSEVDSQRLFNERVFGSKNNCPLELEKVSGNILKKCAGLPLAIITLASYLANGPNGHIKENDKWSILLDSIGHGLEKGDDSVKNMKKILSFSYHDLPSHLKACLLYLSAFPEDCEIGKDRLIRRWIAEGFVKEEKGTSQFKTAESYFNDLINRSMVLPRNIHADGGAEACCVHDMMLDLICELSSEENFVTIVDDMKSSKEKVVMKERKLRRLSLQKGMADLTTTQLVTRSLSQVRSLTIFSPAINRILPLSEFEVLRVLDLEGCDLRGIDLTHVKNLSHLRYLGLRGTKVGSLPMEIGELRLLQTLDVQKTDTKVLPSSVVQLGHLMSLNLSPGMELPKGISRLECLEQLTGLWVGFSSEDSAKELGHLTSLRDLSLKWMNWPALSESICRLPKLESLEILSCEDRGIVINFKPSPNLRRFKFGGDLRSFPTWINSSSLPVLSYLDLYLQEVQTEDIQTLGMLPTLRYVSLEMTYRPGQSRESCRVEKLVLSAGAFPCTRVCLFNKLIMVDPIFQQGAMPMVQRIRFGLRPDDIIRDDFDLNIQNLPSLKQVRIDMYISSSGCKDYSKSMDVLRRVAEDHPRRPVFRSTPFKS